MLLICTLSKGATTMEEVDNMPIPDRKIVLNTLRQVEEEKRKKIEEIQNAKKYDAIRHKSN